MNQSSFKGGCTLCFTVCYVTTGATCFLFNSAPSAISTVKGWLNEYMQPWKNSIIQSTVIPRELNTPLFITGRQKIRNAIQDMNNTINQSDLIDMYRTLNLSTAEYIFSNAYKICTKIGCIWMGHKKSLHRNSSHIKYVSWPTQNSVVNE